MISSDKKIKKLLKLLAMAVWYIGSIMLFIKAYKLYYQAYTINSNYLYISISIIIASIFSILKIKYIFIKSSKKNIERINNLKNPKIWQFYKPGFFIFLIAVISLGSLLSYLAAGNYTFLISVGTIDLALSFALFFSGFLFFKRL